MRRRVTVILLVLAVCAWLPALAQTISDLDSRTFAGVRGLAVPPTPRGDAGKLVDAGVIDVEGFAFLTLNLAAEMKGSGSGEVGAILIPDVPPYDAAFRQLGLVPAAIEISAPITGASAYLMAKQKKVEAGFPRYRVLFYNTSQTTLTVAFFARKTVN